MCKRKPDKVKSLILGGVRQMLGPDYDVATHFTPRYNPWDQRLCLVPDADLFRAIRRKKVTVVTDGIETFTETGIRLKSGAELEADLIVTATGLVLLPLGGMKITVDGRAIDLAKTFLYKGMMYSDVPNLASVFGYTNASWTLKADLVCEYVCRLLGHMERKGYRQVTPRAERSDRNGGAVGRFFLRLHPARLGQAAQAGIEAAVEALSELRAGSPEPAFRLAARQGDGVLALIALLPGVDE